MTKVRVNNYDGGSRATIILTTFVMIVVASLLIGFMISHYDSNKLFILIGGTIVFTLSFFDRVWALYFMVFAMIFSPDFVVSKNSSRDVTVRIEDIILIITMVAWFVNLSIDKTKQVFNKTSVNTPIFIYSFLLIFSTLLGMIYGNVNPKSGIFFTLKLLEYFVLFFMVINTPLDIKQIKRLFYLHIITSLVLGIFGMHQVENGIRVSTPFKKTSEPATMGGCLLLSLSMVVAYLVYYKGAFNKVFYGIIALLLFIPMLYTLSRTTFIGFVATYLTMVILSRKRAIVFVGLLTIASLIIILMPGKVVDRISYTFQGTMETGLKVGTVILEESTAVRIKSYIRVLGWLKESPIFGFGVTGIGFIDGQYFRILGETGVLGLLTFLWMQLSIFLITLHIMQNAKSNFVRIYSIGFMAGHIGLLAHALGASTFIIIRIMELFWFLAALMIHLYNKDNELFIEEEENRYKEFDRKKLPVPLVTSTVDHLK